MFEYNQIPDNGRCCRGKRREAPKGPRTGIVGIGFPTMLEHPAYESSAPSSFVALIRSRFGCREKRDDWPAAGFMDTELRCFQ